jgi:protein transport protein SEC39
MEEVEKVVVESAMTFYDNASNGNKTRGGIKRASEA